MKNLYIFFAFLFSICAQAQIPSNYYDSANGLSGFDLKTELSNIITNGHVDQGYSELHTGYGTTDIDNTTQYDNDGYILDMYSENPNGTDPYNFILDTDKCGNYSNEGDCYNREHLVPQSSFNQGYPMRSDIHHVFPTDGKVNGMRSNYAFGTVGSATNTSQNGSKVGNSNVPGFSGTVFEPIDEFKGDIARAVLYFAVRYENTIDGYTSFDMFNGTNDQVFYPWAIDLLLSWHANDPVTPKEIARNIAAYNFQGNANPFVDHPEYANLIWNPNPDTEAPTAPTNLVASNPTDNSVFLTWTAATDNTGVTSYDIYVDGSNTFNTSNTSFTVTGLMAATEYCFTVKARDAAANQSDFSNQACETTTNNGAGTDCFAESFENIPANSGSYSTRTWTGDDGGNWTATDARTDQTLNNRAITVRNGVITAPTTSGGIGAFTVSTKRVYGGSSGTFNLKVNGSVVGTIAYGDQDVSQTITIPNINIEGNVSVVIDGNSSTSNRVVFDDLSWTCYSTIGIGEHSLNELSIYPNPVENRLNIQIKDAQETQIEIYNILGKVVFSKTLQKSQSIALDHLKTGVYIIKLTQGSSTITKKLIKQ
ncbi:endonuclease [Xanthomarina sp. F1114]|uniref:endonuclease n=1 Tax=Xanthomarina sp. F1114 TaxID=2996019 RepID=UPI00225E133C|nr:endonuclease [Xanthomarina sp. F1114]MCX7549091.1 endonuclease [Xanthomarina sp. F1114]